CHERPVIVSLSDAGSGVTEPWKGGAAPICDCEGAARRSAQATAALTSTVRTSRGGRIRTGDLPLPKRALYQAELHPVWRKSTARGARFPSGAAARRG